MWVVVKGSKGALTAVLKSISIRSLIVTTGGLWGEVPNLILNVGETQAEEAFVWWKEQFGHDFYAEIVRHGLDEEKHVNKILLQLCAKHNVKYIASNNTYYTNQGQAEAHDILLCVKDGESVNKPKRYLGKRGREFRYGFPNDEFYIKSPEEMKKLFADLPDARRAIRMGGPPCTPRLLMGHLTTSPPFWKPGHRAA